MSMKADDRCETCIFWCGGVAHEGQCRRRAPVVSGMRDTTGGQQGTWPSTSRQDWCGEHVEKTHTWRME